MIDADKMMAVFCRAFGEPVTYKAYGSAPVTISAIRSVNFVENSFDGHGYGPQRVMFKIASAGIPRPGARDTITDASGTVWYIAEVPEFAWEGEWTLVVNTSPAGRRA